jgi:uncharacterized protein (DUF2252 family)
MNIVEATDAYERWADKRIDLVAKDIKLKHREMARAPFPFMRATFYRWAMIWPALCPELDGAPTVLAVGDLHVENFGTWRDGEGRLIWGINDFDEAFAMPYTLDLVRLAASALLAIEGAALAVEPGEACAAVLAGYREVIADDVPQPFVLEESHPSLRAMALGTERDPAAFWAKLSKLRPVAAPRAVHKLLAKQFPESAEPLRVVHRVAGLGSLGRPRYLGLAVDRGGLIAREAKAVLPSAYGFARKTRVDRVFYEAIVERSSRAGDPFIKIKKGWLLRRIGPHCSRIDLADLPKERDEMHLLRCMGRETANVHLGNASSATAIRRDLKRRGRHWLHAAARKMAAAIRADWRQWRAAA